MEQIKDRRIRSFEDLLVWQKGIALVKDIYIATDMGPLQKDFGLRDQLRRAAVSIPTNVAEGFERSFHKEYLHFLNIAKGSAGELRSLLRVALEIGYLKVSQYDALKAATLELSSYLSNQMRSLRAKGG